MALGDLLMYLLSTMMPAIFLLLIMTSLGQRIEAGRLNLFLSKSATAMAPMDIRINVSSGNRDG